MANLRRFGGKTGPTKDGHAAGWIGPRLGVLEGAQPTRRNENRKHIARVLLHRELYRCFKYGNRPPNAREAGIAEIHREPHPEHPTGLLSDRCYTDLTATSDVPAAPRAEPELPPLPQETSTLLLLWAVAVPDAQLENYDQNNLSLPEHNGMHLDAPTMGLDTKTTRHDRNRREMAFLQTKQTLWSTNHLRR